VKIGLISPYDFSVPGGANQHILNLSQQFVADGHSVRIVAPSSEPDVVDKHPNVTVVGRAYPVPADGSIARMAISLSLAKPVQELLAEEQFDVVHLHEPMQGPLPITVLRFSTAVNVGTFHAYSESRYSTGSMAYYYGRQVLKRWFRKLDGKIAVSDAASEFVGQFFPGFYNIIPNGIDYDHFSRNVAPIPEFMDDKANILFVGRLERRKGVKYLLRAFQLVKREFPDCRLILVGAWNKERAAGYQRWVNNNVEDVHFIGYTSHEELARFYRTADIFCAPATGDESFGIVLLEAMAAGKPIVASNIRGYASVMTNGVEGLLVTPKNTNSLAFGIVQLLANEGLRREMGMNGEIKAREYSWDRIARRVLSYYDRILLEVSNHSGTRPARPRKLSNLVSPWAQYVGIRR
jgi:phosphatidylinositol alpha-mannosyltransferase